MVTRLAVAESTEPRQGSNELSVFPNREPAACVVQTGRTCRAGWLQYLSGGGEAEERPFLANGS